MLDREERKMLKDTHDSTLRNEVTLGVYTKKTDAHEKILHGNGWWGLVSRVRVLWFAVVTVGLATGLVVLRVVLAGN